MFRIFKILCRKPDCEANKQENSPNGYVTTAGAVQEMELNARSKQCSDKGEKQVKVSYDWWQYAGYIMTDVCMKFH